MADMAFNRGESRRRTLRTRGLEETDAPNARTAGIRQAHRYPRAELSGAAQRIPNSTDRQRQSESRLSRKTQWFPDRDDRPLRGYGAISDGGLCVRHTCGRPVDKLSANGIGVSAGRPATPRRLPADRTGVRIDRKSTRLNSSH